MHPPAIRRAHVSPLRALLRDPDPAVQAQGRELLATLGAEGVQRALAPLKVLRGFDLAGLDFARCSLAGKDLRETDLSGARLVGADLRGARMTETDLRGADLRGAQLCGVQGSVHLAGADLRGADLSGAVLRLSALDGVDLRGACLRGAHLSGRLSTPPDPPPQFQGADLSGATLSGLHLGAADLQGADLRRASLCSVRLCGADVTDARLEGALLRSCHLENMDLRHLPWHALRLEDLSAPRSDLAGAMLAGVSLRSLDGADLTGAVLRGAWARHPAALSLRDAVLVDADLSGVDLEQAPSFSLVWIPPGTFWMGSPGRDPSAYSDEKPRHAVTIPRGFWMGTTPVTQRLWYEVMGSRPAGFLGDDRCPIESVSWCDAVIFANRLSRREGLEPAYILPTGFVMGMNHATSNRCHSAVTWRTSASGYRLPTEAEWEYAARAGTDTRYWSGDTEDDLARVGWYAHNADQHTRPVGAQDCPNPWGLHDVHGNVWEWCFDIYHSEVYRRPLPLLARERGLFCGEDRVSRGGSWTDAHDRARAGFRNGIGPGLRRSNLGFRLARSADPGD